MQKPKKDNPPNSLPYDSLFSTTDTQSPEGLYLERAKGIRQALNFEQDPSQKFNAPYKNPFAAPTTGEQRENIYGETQDLSELRGSYWGQSGGRNVFSRKKKEAEKPKRHSILARRIGK